MTETPRQYKRRIDEKWKTNEKNRDKLIQRIEEYELVDQRFKAETKQEILEDFEKNKKAEKEGNLYVKILEELEGIESKYQELKKINENLKGKKQEKADLLKQLEEQNVDGMDKTTLKLQSFNLEKIKEKLKLVESEIKEIEIEIAGREQEIKEMEESYGKKQDNVVSNSGGNQIEKPINTMVEMMDKKPTTLNEYREGTIKHLWRIDYVRHEIIKLLDEGAGIDDKLRDKIEKEISDRFFDYYDESQGSLRMKSVGYLKNRENILERSVDSLNMIGGKVIREKEKHGKKCVMRGKEQIGDWFEGISNFIEIGGKPAFIARKGGKLGVMRGKEQIGDWFDVILDFTEIGGKPVFRARRHGAYCEMRGKDRIQSYCKALMVEGKVVWKIEKNGEKCLIRGKDRIDSYHELGKVEGKVVWKIEKDGESCLMRGKEQIGDWFDYIYPYMGMDGGPVFVAIKDGKKCVMRGKEQIGDWFDGISNFTTIRGKPVFIVRKDGKLGVMGGKEQLGGWFDYIHAYKEIRGKLAFLAEKDGKWCLMRGKEQIGNWFDPNIKMKEFDDFIRKNRQGNDIGNEVSGDQIDAKSQTIKVENKSENISDNLSETQSESREKIILERYKKKLNRDELLNIILGIDCIDQKIKTELKLQILDDFYQGYKNAISDQKYQESDKQYRILKKTSNDYHKKSAELKKKKEELKPQILEIDGELYEIANSAMKLEDGGRRKSRKLNKTKKKWDDLEIMRKKMFLEISKLKDEKSRLELNLSSQQKRYGKKVGRPKIEGKVLKKDTAKLEKLKSESTLKGYKEAYMKLINDKEKYVKELLEQIEGIDFGISEEKKKEVTKEIKSSLEKELEVLKEGDEITKLADETEKWLKENWERVMEQLNELKGKIEEKEKEIEELNSTGKGNSSDEIIQLKEMEIGLRNELIDLNDQYEYVRSELNEKLKNFDGTSID